MATALAASIYSAVIGRQTAEGAEPPEALSSGLGTASWVMAVFSVAGVLMAVVMGRHRAAQGTLYDAAGRLRPPATPCPPPATADPAAAGRTLRAARTDRATLCGVQGGRPP